MVSRTRRTVENSKWLTQYGWAVEDGHIHTRIDVCPRIFCCDPEKRFVVRVEVYEGTPNPILVCQSSQLDLEDVWRFEVKDELSRVGKERCHAVAKIQVEQVGHQPRKPTVLQAYMNWYSDDGFVELKVAGNQVVGHQIGDYLTGTYEIFPGVPGDPSLKIKLLLLNHQWAEIAARAVVYAADGRTLESRPFSVLPYSPRTIEIEDILPEYHTFLKPEEFGTLQLETQYRTSNFILFQKRETGALYMIDHFSRFFGRSRRIQSRFFPHQTLSSVKRLLIRS